MIINTTVEITNDRIVDLVVNGFESGAISYWCSSVKPAIFPSQLRDRGVDSSNIDEVAAPWYSGTVRVNDDLGGLCYTLVSSLPWWFYIHLDEAIDDNKIVRYIIGAEQIKAALQIMAEKHNDMFMDIINENDDADTADIFLQLCCFKEVIFS
jgi:hypothetical protein